MKLPLKVKEKYRKNSLSLTGGGSDVKIIYCDGTQFIYDKIKNVEAYLNKIKKLDEIAEIWVNDVQVFPITQI